MKALAFAKQSRRKNPRVVYDEQLIAAKEFGKIREAAVFPAARGTVQQQKTGLFAAFEGPLGDPVMRKEVVEIFELHRVPTITKQEVSRAEGQIADCETPAGGGLGATMIFICH